MARLAEGDADLTEICEALKIEKGGKISQYLSDLEETQYITRHHSWNLKKIPTWDSIMGLQFENLVINNFKQLQSILSIPADQIINEGPYLQTQTKLHRGCQIDYLIQLRYNSLYVCEIKYSTKPVGFEIIEEVQEKINRLYHPRIQFSVRPVLVHVNGVSDSVREASFFTHIADFAQFI